MWTIDSRNITDFNASENKLEALIIFWILAAGKTAKGAEKILSSMLPDENVSPFAYLRDTYQTQHGIMLLIKSFGCGCFNAKSKALFEIIYSGINLRTCSVEKLETIYGIGFKTARAFIVHSRKDSNYAIIDTHILKHLASLGHEVPKSTPLKREYLKLEKIFLEICKEKNKTPAEYDLEIWKSYAV